MASIGLGLAIITVILAMALYAREVFRVSKTKRKWVMNLLNILIIPLMIIFVILIIITFSNLISAI
jgi:hypothetical protein